MRQIRTSGSMSERWRRGFWGDTRAPATERAGNTQGFPGLPRHLSTLLIFPLIFSRNLPCPFVILSVPFDFIYSPISEVAPSLPVTWVVECKLAPTPRAIAVEELRNLYGAKTSAGASNALLVTNARFTPGAKSFAESKSDLHLIDYDQVMAWLEKNEPDQPAAPAYVGSALPSVRRAGRS
jgi:hypothetical protein